MELEAAIADFSTKDDLDLIIKEAMAMAIREGRIVDSGRRRNGKILWIRADRLPH